MIPHEQLRLRCGQPLPLAPLRRNAATGTANQCALSLPLRLLLPLQLLLLLLPLLLLLLLQRPQLLVVQHPHGPLQHKGKQQQRAC